MLSLRWVGAIIMPESLPPVSQGEVVTAEQVNSKRYFVKETKPTDDEGYIGDVCFVIGGVDQ